MLGDPVTVVASASAAVAAGFFVLGRRRGAPAPLAGVGGVHVFSGLVALGLSSAHLVSVIGGALARLRAAAFAYDFRFYSLLLVGFAIATPALFCALQGRGLARGEVRAWRRAFWASVVLLAVNAPLMPIQGFAVGFTGLALLNLAALGLTRARFAPAPGAEVSPRGGGEWKEGGMA